MHFCFLFHRLSYRVLLRFQSLDVLSFFDHCSQSGNRKCFLYSCSAFSFSALNDAQRSFNLFKQFLSTCHSFSYQSSTAFRSLSFRSGTPENLGEMFEIFSSMIRSIAICTPKFWNIHIPLQGTWIDSSIHWSETDDENWKSQFVLAHQIVNHQNHEVCSSSFFEMADISVSKIDSIWSVILQFDFSIVNAMYMQYIPEHLHDFIRFDYVTCESTWSPDRTTVLDVGNIHDMIGDSKYLFYATLLYNVSKIQKWKIYRHNSGSFLWKFPDTNIKTKNLKINLVSFVYDISMSKRSDRWYEKDLKHSAADLFILFQILHLSFKPSIVFLMKYSAENFLQSIYFLIVTKVRSPTQYISCLHA